MSKLSIKNKLIIEDIDLIKSSYKINHPSQTYWNVLGKELKIGQHPSNEAYKYQHQNSQDISCDAFFKTKLLFKPKTEESSVLEEDLTNQYIFADQKYFESRQTEQEFNNFEFESFGRHPNNQKQNSTKQNNDHDFKDNLHDKTKQWNSSSIQINFDKVIQEDLCLPDLNNKINEKIMFDFNKIGQSQQSIKQFCFRLNENQHIQGTPVKKWSDLKRKRLIVNQHVNNNKYQLKKILLNFLQKLETIPSEQITEQMVTYLQQLLKSLGKTQRKPLKQTMVYVNDRNNKRSIEKINPNKGRLYTEINKSTIKNGRKQISLATQQKQNSKFRLYQLKTTSKSTKKTVKQQPRFKF